MSAKKSNTRPKSRQDAPKPAAADSVKAAKAKRDQAKAVVQSTEPGHGDHSARWTGTSDRHAVRKSLLCQQP